MRRIIASISIICLSLLLIAPATAQEGSSDLLQQLPGLENAWAKRYDNPDMYSHFAEATPAAVTTRTLSATVLEFDTEASARLTFSMALSDETAAMILGVDPSDLLETESVELGDQATLFTARSNDESSTLLAIRDGNLGFLISAWGPSNDTVSSVRAVAEFMISAEPGSGEILFEQYGESSGGLFDLFPRFEDSDVLQGLIPMYEYNLLISDHPLEYPATPAA